MPVLYRNLQAHANATETRGGWSALEGNRRPRSARRVLRLSICGGVYFIEVGCSRNCLNRQDAFLSRFRPRMFQGVRSSRESNIETRSMVNHLQWGAAWAGFFSFLFLFLSPTLSL